MGLYTVHNDVLTYDLLFQLHSELNTYGLYHRLRHAERPPVVPVNCEWHERGN